MNEPKISVVMPSLNVHDYIGVCLESVVNQSLRDLEIICVDAGSTDGTLEIIESYARQDSRITLIHSDRKSYGYQVNLGFRAATAPYFAIVETDDIINLQMYETLYQVAVETDVDIVKGDFCRFEIKDGVMCKKYANIAKPHLYGRILTKEYNRTDIITNAALYTWAGIYKRSFLLNNGIAHNESPGASYQDNGFWFQTMAMANTVYFVNTPFYMLRRDNPNSSTMSKAKVYCIRDEYEFVLDYLKARPEVYSALIPYYWWARFGAYRYNYNRIALEYKEEFLRHFQEVFTPVLYGPEFDESIFSKTSYNDIKNIVDNTDTYLKRTIRIASRTKMRPTYLRRFLWVVEDHGLWYTVGYAFKRVLRHFGIRTRSEKREQYLIKPLNRHVTKRTQLLEAKLDRLLEDNQRLVLIAEQNSRLLEDYEIRLCALEESRK